MVAEVAAQAVIFEQLHVNSVQPYLPWIWDAETQRWTGADQETVDFHLTQGEIWLASVAGQAVALVLSHTENGSMPISLIVRPELRRNGWGKRVLQAFVNVFSGKTLLANIDEDHAASLRCFEANGFAPTGPANENGYILYQRYAGNTRNV